MPTQPQIVKQERSSNLELYRIIVMLLIVAHHSIVNSGVMDLVAADPLSAKSTFAYLFGMWGKTGINCFVMITGYFMCMSSISLRKWFKLVLEVIFYNMVIAAIFWLTGYTPFTLKGLYTALMPIHDLTEGFTSAFVIFYLCIPFLNKLVHALTQKEHCWLIVLSLVIYTLSLFIPGMKIHLVYVTWFCIIFFIASFIRLYPNAIPHANSAPFWRNITLGLVALALISSVAMVRLLSGHNVWNAFRFVSDSNAILAVAIAVSSFMWFKNIQIKQSKLINTIAASTFGVLCIHANSDAMRQWLWKDLTNISALFRGGYFAAKMIIVVLVIFAVCVAIDYCRIHCIEAPTFKLLDKKLATKMWWK